jgi:hypothetical protein
MRTLWTSKSALKPEASLGWPQDWGQYCYGSAWHRRGLHRLIDLVGTAVTRLQPSA